MNIHEYQAKEILRQYGIVVPIGAVISDIEDIAGIIEKNQRWALKAQIHAGARGYAGGIKIVNSVTEAQILAKNLLNSRLKTKQTTESGLRVEKIYLERADFNIKREIYIALTIDRRNATLRLSAAFMGGVNIEEHSQDNWISIDIDCLSGIRDFHIKRIASFLNLDSNKQFSDLLSKLYKIFREKDCLQIEINPLAEDFDNNLLPLDCKIILDDNSAFRNPLITELYDPSQLDEKEVIAARHNLHYVKIGGNIGSIANGAGLAMSSMDLITAAGGSPANFLDVGGDASADRISTAFNLLYAEKNIRGIYVNIYGGILSCFDFANGIIKALSKTHKDKARLPLVVRFAGNDADKGVKILSKLDIVTVQDMDEGAKIIVDMVNNNGDIGKS